MGRRSKYPEEFRQRAAQLVLDSRRSVRDVAGELGVNHETLRNWVAAERRQRADGPAALSADERFELARLRRKVAELELEREILKKPRSSTLQAQGRHVVGRTQLPGRLRHLEAADGLRKDAGRGPRQAPGCP